MLKFRKREIVIEAFQMTLARRHSNSEWPQWLHDAWNAPTDCQGTLQIATSDPELLRLVLCTDEGPKLVEWNDWIIWDAHGELHLLAPDRFEQLYEPVEQQKAAAPVDGTPLAKLCDAVAVVSALTHRPGCGTDRPLDQLEECAQELARYVQTIVHPDDDEPVSPEGFLRLGLRLIDNAVADGEPGYNYKDAFTICRIADDKGWMVYSDEYAPELFDPETLGDVRHLMRMADRRKQ